MGTCSSASPPSPSDNFDAPDAPGRDGSMGNSTSKQSQPRGDRYKGSKGGGKPRPSETLPAATHRSLGVLHTDIVQCVARSVPLSLRLSIGRFSPPSPHMLL